VNADQWRTEQRNARKSVELLRRSREPAPPEEAPSTPSPLASVIVVCWNSADVLGRCLNQLLAQDYFPYELIVVDDGSQDDTIEIAERAPADGKLTIVRSLRNRGCPHARNLGLRHARGEIIVFIDADGFAAPGWLRHIVAMFRTDEAIGGVASTVFFADNPLVLNGAGGTVNRQGWAADLSMNESYEHAQIAPEALYAMGCGMAIRRSATERVGPFDDRMLNYYDDVDYGVRLWRAGYKVVIAPDAWIDHGFGQSATDQARKQLLCERHRVRVVLKHAPASILPRWAAHEWRAAKDATPARRALKLRAMAWNLFHLPSTLSTRRRLRQVPRAPERLIHRSWGDGFPAGVPPRRTPRPEFAASGLDMADPASETQLIYGWFPVERDINGRSYRWAGVEAAALVRLDAPTRLVRLDYAHVPVDTGGVELKIRRLGSADPLTPVWTTYLSWQYVPRSVENHLLALAPGDYEVAFSTENGWRETPLETRLLGFALTRIAFEETLDIATDGLDMAATAVEDQLLTGWFQHEHQDGRSYRWATGHSAVIVRVAEAIHGLRMSYRLPPGSIGVLRISVRRSDSETVVWSTRISWRDQAWHDAIFQVNLNPSDYIVTFDTERTWSNPGGKDDAFGAEDRALGFILSSLSFKRS